MAYSEIRWQSGCAAETDSSGPVKTTAKTSYPIPRAPARGARQNIVRESISARTMTPTSTC